MSPSAGPSLPSDDITVQTSNVSPHSCKPDVSTLADDDPSTASLLDTASTASCHSSEEDFFCGLDEGRDHQDILSSINSIDVPTHQFVPSNDTHSEEPTGPPEPHSPAVDHDPDVLRAQLDTGAFATVTDQLHMLHGYRAFDASHPSPVRLLPATVGSDAVPEGWGYLHVPAHNAAGFLAVRTFYHPSLRTTVIDERDLFRAAGHSASDIHSEKIHKYYDAGTFTYHATHKLKYTNDIIIHGILRDGKCYTNGLIPPDLDPSSPHATPATSSASALASDPDFAADCQRAFLYSVHAYQEAECAQLRSEFESLPAQFHDLPFHEYIQQNTPVAAIRAATERLLWHQRLGHPSDHYLYNAHKHIKGVPKFKHMDAILDSCPTCIRAKQTKEPAGPNTTRTATQPYQGLSIDFSFSGTKSKNDDTRQRDYVGINGETCWILITDHFTRMKHGDTRISKGSPIHWLRNFLEDHSPACRDKYVFLDQGGELYKNPAIVTLLQRFGYDVRPTGADASNQNGPVERGHLTVGNALRSMLLGANLPIKFWPYAFHHYMRIDNSFPSRDQTQTPLLLATGKVDDFTAFRTFGCRVWVRPPGRRRAKLVPNSRKGIFLGFLPNTTKNIVWYDPETERVKTAKHARFDEGMNDLPAEAIPPNVVHLQRLQQGDPLPAEPSESSIDEFYFTTNPFSHTLTRHMKVKCKNPTFGITVSTDELTDRAYISDIKRDSSVSKLYSSYKATCNKIRGAYIVKIGDTPVFTQDEAILALRHHFDSNAATVTLELAPERRLDAKHLRRALLEHNIFKPHDIDDDDHVPSLTVADVRAIAALRYPDVDFSEHSVTTEQVGILLQAIQSQAITPAEQALGRFTRRKLKNLTTWPEWRHGEHKQLDHFHALRMFGSPVSKPHKAIVLRPHWQYSVKRDGTRRSRNCCDGSPKSAPVLHGIASTYSSCVEQPVQRLFFALAAQLGHKVYGGDAQDAYAHSPPPETPTFVTIDDAYADWYKERHGQDIDRSQVLPVLHALQGHPESGRLWEAHINSILFSPKLGFKSTTHDRSIYSATIRGERVLLLRQVDDFALSCSHEAIARHIYDIIGRSLQLPSETSPPFKYLGLLTDFNGLDVHQYDDSIVLSCERYIDRLLTTHGWTEPSDAHLSSHATPLHTDAINSVYANPGFPEGSPEHSALTRASGFSYRTLLGELLYAYVTCRPDIGYSTITLSKFSTCPHSTHFNLLKKVAKYLRATKDWGIIYRKPHRDPSLPSSPHARVAPDMDLPAFPQPSSPLDIEGFVDSAHANDLRNRRSTTGYAFILSGGAVSYRCKTQSITATSSTEAEFLAAVTAAKHAKYLRAIMRELGFPPARPTRLHCDNQSAINMINARVPTERSRHIDIQHFAIQDWKEAGDIVMSFIPGIINPSDDLTKPLGWILHDRHARRIMGHY